MLHSYNFLMDTQGLNDINISRVEQSDYNVNFTKRVQANIDTHVYTKLWLNKDTGFDRFFFSSIKRLNLLEELLPISTADLESSETKQIAFILAAQYYFGAGFFSGHR